MISKPLTSLLFTLLAIPAFAQEHNVNSKFQVGLNLSPDICYRQIFVNKGNEGNDLLPAVINLRNSSERAKISYSGGLSVVYRQNQRFSFQTGLNYANLGYKSEIAGFIGPVDEILPLSAKYIYNLHYLELPTKVNFIFGENRLQYSVGAGLTSAYLMEKNNTLVSYYGDSTTRKNIQSQDAYKPFNLFATLNVGLHYQLSNKLQLKFEPTIRYGLLQISDTPISGRVYNFGLNTGIYLEL
jgi:hypothetical protein